MNTDSQPPTDSTLAGLILTEGQKLAGTYVLRRQIAASGALAPIWAADDEVLGKGVTLHFLPPELLGDGEAMDRVRQAVKRTRQLIHPNILRVLDLVEEDTWAALSMEVFAGEPLSRQENQSEDFEIGKLQPWLAQLGQTLNEAHAVHFIHGDVAAENVFVDVEGKPTLAYFGVGRVVQDALVRANRPASSTRLAGVSPQVLEGQAPTQADDVYSFGALLFKFLAGEDVFTGADVTTAIRETVPKSVAEARSAAGRSPLVIPAELEEVIAACLHKDPAARPGSVSEVMQRIDTAGVFAPPAPVPAPLPVIEAPAALEPAVLPVEEVVASAPSEAAVEPLQVLPASTELHIKQAEAPKSGAKSRLAPLAPISHLKPASNGFPTIGLAAALLALAGLAAYHFGSSKPQPPAEISTTDRSAGAELTPVNNALPALAPDKTAPLAQLAAEPPQTLTPASTPAMLLAAATKATPTPPPVVAGNPDDKAAALEKIKQAVAAADKSKDDLLKQKQIAEAAVAEMQKTLDEKTKAAEPAKKALEEGLALRKKKEDEQKAAELAAQQAQQMAAEKARAAEESRKEVADLDLKAKEKAAIQAKADAELQALQKKVAEKQVAVAEAAKALSTLEAARQQQGTALQQIEQEVAKAAADKAQIAEAERKRQSVDAERRKIDEDLASMKAMFEQKMKEIETRRQQLETGSAVPPSASTSQPVATPLAVQKLIPVATPATTPVAVATPKATPANDPALLAMKNPEMPRMVPVIPAGAEFQNSLGMKFVPVGDAYFCIWQTRVKDFEVFAQAVNLKSTAWKGPGFKQGPEHPVVNVTWNEAIAFCKWLTEKERKEGVLTPTQFYRLPYDLEWSVAVGLPEEIGKNPEARDMGIPDVYPWGTAWPPPKGAGNYTGEETGSDVAIKGYDDSFPWTSPVGSFPANKYGLYDMGGNVWQWCMDGWNTESKAKVLRGASWYNGALKLSLLSSCRVHASPDSSTDNYGFRILRVTETPRAIRK